MFTITVHRRNANQSTMRDHLTPVRIAAVCEREERERERSKHWWYGTS
jgi:hypothetical protein